VRETSGLARGRSSADVFWTHNDSGNEPLLFALASDGTIRTRIPLRNVTLRDWEDLEGGVCGDANCLYLADIGDNAGLRTNITIYEVVEPALTDREADTRRHERPGDIAIDSGDRAATEGSDCPGDGGHRESGRKVGGDPQLLDALPLPYRRAARRRRAGTDAFADPARGKAGRIDHAG
jgi:hypothetical protein